MKNGEGKSNRLLQILYMNGDQVVINNSWMNKKVFKKVRTYVKWL